MHDGIQKLIIRPDKYQILMLLLIISYLGQSNCKMDIDNQYTK